MEGTPRFMKLTDYEKEKIKLLAATLDRASTACFTVGIATPTAGFLYNVSNFGNSIGGLRLMLSVTAWFFGAIMLHFLARQVLKGLK
jgi:hypothetical protein